MEEKRFLYVLFLLTPFGTGKLVRIVTGYPYCHSGISFSPELKYFYSFSRYYLKTPFYAGFTMESVLRYDQNGKTAKIKICAVPVSEENYQNAKKQIEDMKRHADEYIYNFISAVAFPFRKTVKVKNSYTCVEFVLSMVRKYSDIPELKEEKFLSIEDFCEMLDSYKIYEGDIEKFFEGANWEEDHFAEEKSIFHRWKAAIKNNIKLLRRFIKNEK